MHVSLPCLQVNELRDRDFCARTILLVRRSTDCSTFAIGTQIGRVSSAGWNCRPAIRGQCHPRVHSVLSNPPDWQRKWHTHTHLEHASHHPDGHHDFVKFLQEKLRSIAQSVDAPQDQNDSISCKNKYALKRQMRKQRTLPSGQIISCRELAANVTKLQGPEVTTDHLNSQHPSQL